MDSRAQPTVVAIDDTANKRYKIYYYYEADAWELYCLSDDPGEANNLIEEQPDIASEPDSPLPSARRLVQAMRTSIVLNETKKPIPSTEYTTVYSCIVAPVGV